MLGVQKFLERPNVSLTRRTLSIVEPVSVSISVAVTSATQKTVTIQTDTAGYYLLKVWLAPATGQPDGSLTPSSTIVSPAYRLTDATGLLTLELNEPAAKAWRVGVTVVSKAKGDGDS